MSAIRRNLDTIIQVVVTIYVEMHVVGGPVEKLLPDLPFSLQFLLGVSLSAVATSLAYSFALARPNITGTWRKRGQLETSSGPELDILLTGSNLPQIFEIRYSLESGSLLARLVVAWIRRARVDILLELTPPGALTFSNEGNKSPRAVIQTKSLRLPVSRQAQVGTVDIAWAAVGVTESSAQSGLRVKCRPRLAPARKRDAPLRILVDLSPSIESIRLVGAP